MFKADGKARVEAHGFVFNYQTIFACDDCMCTQPFPSVIANPRLDRLSYLQTGPRAPWRKTLITHDMYMNHSKYLTPWRLIPGWHKSLSPQDWLHVGPLGILRDFGGSYCIDSLDRGDLAAKFAHLGAFDSDGASWNRLTADGRPRLFASRVRIGLGQTIVVS